MSIGDQDRILYSPAVAEAAQEIGTFEGSMDGELAQLYNQFRALFGAEWAGQAQEACDLAQQQWNKGATEIKEALGRVAMALGASLDSINQLDRRLASQFGG